MESFYLRGHTIQEVGGKMMIGSSIYGVAVIDGYMLPILWYVGVWEGECECAYLCMLCVYKSKWCMWVCTRGSSTHHYG